MGGKPRLPIAVIGKIGACEPLSSPGPVAGLDPLRVLPAERGEGHDPRVEPDVADLGDPLDAFRSACRAADLDGVDPRPVELLKLFHPGRRQILELGAGADDGDVAACAGIDRER